MEETTQHCKMEGCKRPYRAKGYCQVHYRKWRNGELKKPRYKTCNAAGCHKPMTQAGLCETHYKEAWGLNKGEGAAKEEAVAPAAEAPKAGT